MLLFLAWEDVFTFSEDQNSFAENRFLINGNEAFR